MSLTRIVNLRLADAIHKSERYLGYLEKPFTGLFRGVFTRRNGEWSLLLGRLDVGREGKDLNYKKRLEYPEYLFVVEKIKYENVARIFSDISEGKIPGNEGALLDVGENGFNWTETLIPSHATEEGFPIRRFHADINRDASFQEMKLVAYGNPFHFSASQYVKEFLSLSEFHGSMDGRKGSIFVDIVDRRARLLISDQDISYETSIENKIGLVGAVDGKKVDLVGVGGKFPRNLGSSSDTELWLIDKNNEVIDYCSSSEWEFRYGSVENSSEEGDLLNIISRGESEHCEFKEYIDLTERRNHKIYDIEKAVCALSNHEGGVLFVGVSDDTEILGINDGVSRAYGCDLINAIELYKKDFSKRLQETLKKNQCFDISAIEVAGLFVLVVRVEKVNGLNYLTKRNEVYVRRGSSSAKMTPAEIQALSSGKDPFEAARYY